jgi:putative DNA primase/helicase
MRFGEPTVFLAKACLMNKPVAAVLRLTPQDAEDFIAQDQKIEASITQDGIARLFAAKYSGQLRYCHDAGRWFEWTGTHWTQDKTDAAFEFVRVLAREISETADAKIVKQVRQVAFARGVETFARSDPAFAVTSASWDRDKFLLGTPAGTVDLRTGRLQHGSSDDGITKVTAAAPADTADCPLFERFLVETTGGDRDLIRFLQKWFGYSLTGDIREHALSFGYGPGGNGKGVLLNTIVGIMGDYAVVAPADTFTASIGDRHPTDVAMLRGARMVAASETENGRKWAESRIKSLTGGDPVTARFMRRDFFTFMPEFKIFMVGNHEPTLDTVDDAARRRINIIPFLHKPAYTDNELTDKLRSEWPAILRWAIDGCLDWQYSGLSRPKSVLDATADYFEDQDLFGQWLDDCCEISPANDRMFETSAALYKSWCRYSNAAGEKPGTKKAFAALLKRRKVSEARTKAARGFVGITLNDVDDVSDLI